VSARATDIDDTAATTATTTATATATGLRLMPSGCAADADTLTPERPADGRGADGSSRGSEKAATATETGNVRRSVTMTSNNNCNYYIIVTLRYSRFEERERLERKRKSV
jgi:hypothetical protein